jgi:hypothetical protein
MKYLTVVVFILFCLTPVFGQSKGQDSVPAFTDQDLKKFGGSSSTGSSPGRSSDVQKASGKNVSDKKATSIKGELSDLKRIEVPYKGYVGTARRIIVDVKLNDSVTVPMAVDTGSPGMVISTEVAEKLNILKKDDGQLMTQSRGIGGTTQSIFTIVDSVEVGEIRDEFIPTQIIDELFPGFEGLIGMDFMANYTLKIDNEKEVLVFEEQPSSENRPGGHDEAWWRQNFAKFSAMRNQYLELKQQMDSQQIDMPTQKKLKEFVDRQYPEAEKLYNRLEAYAVRHSVPMQWRSY